MNGGGWSRPASDFAIDGSTMDGKSFPGPCAVNCTNGEAFTTFPLPYYAREGSGEAYSFHVGGINVVMADGSVQWINDSIALKEFARLVTRSGGGSSPSFE